MPPRASQVRCWCFTLNNPTDAERDCLERLVSDQYCPPGYSGSARVSFIVFGREHFGPQPEPIDLDAAWTPHFQGYVEFTSKLALTSVKQFLGSRAHIEPRSGTQDQAITYCSKEDTTPFRAGEPIANSGDSGRAAERARWSDAYLAARNGDFDAIPADILIRSYRTLHEIHDDAKWEESARSRPRLDLQPYKWQADALGIIAAPVHPRKIHFVTDPAGNTGKSYFCHHLCRDVPGAVVLHPGRAVDLAYLLKQPPRVVLLDCSRDVRHADVPWRFLEDLKNGCVVSTKYSGQVKSFSPCHVMVLTNHQNLWIRPGRTPDEAGESVLSEDRILEWTINTQSMTMVRTYPL